VKYDTLNIGPWEEDRFHVVYSANYEESRTKFRSSQCNVQLCASPHFKLYHVKLHFQTLPDVIMEKVGHTNIRNNISSIVLGQHFCNDEVLVMFNLEVEF
jgi:hypothetical protein